MDSDGNPTHGIVSPTEVTLLLWDTSGARGAGAMSLFLFTRRVNALSRGQRPFFPLFFEDSRLGEIWFLGVSRTEQTSG